jgi:lysozyme family protein
MLSITSPLFQAYVKHNASAEGGKSSNPKDTASKYVQPGQVHTNRGVTWNTYKSLASKLGLYPDYNSFLNLTKDGAVKFIYQNYLDNAKDLPDQTGIAVTESSWASGPSIASQNLIAAVNTFGKNVKSRKNAAMAAKTIDDKKLALAVNAEQKKFYQTLVDRDPGQYSTFLKGWKDRSDRLAALIQNTNPAIGLASVLLIAAIFFLIRQSKQG